MLFIYPMWDHESQRIGKQKCTPFGYALHGIAEMLGFLGLLLLLGTGAYLGYRGITGTFHVSLLWLLAIPFGLGIMGETLYQVSWELAARKGFHYDPNTCEASWTEAGKRLTYPSPSDRSTAASSEPAPGADSSAHHD
jgi:hypothetical protein